MVGLSVAVARTVSKIWAIMLIYVALLCSEASWRLADAKNSKSHSGGSTPILRRIRVIF